MKIVDPISRKEIEVKSVCYPTVSILKGAVWERHITLLDEYRAYKKTQPTSRNHNGWRG